MKKNIICLEKLLKLLCKNILKIQKYKTKCLK
jgi:hypothetical protein